MTQKQVMIDIETLGISHNAVIVSIGATQFTLDRGVQTDYVLPTFYKRIRPQLQHNRAIDADTVLWWLKQDQAAKSATFFEGESCSLEIALKALEQFMGQWDPRETIIWANGVGFDITILDHAFAQNGLKSPWRYSNISCMRTLKNLLSAEFSPDTVPRIGTAHNALDDAKWQANYVSAALRFMREKTSGAV